MRFLTYMYYVHITKCLPETKVLNKVLKLKGTLYDGLCANAPVLDMHELRPVGLGVY